MERSLVIFKPDAVARGIVGEIITRFERAGLKIVGIKMLEPSYEHYFEHYEGIGTLKTRKGEEIFESQVATMQDGPVVAMILEGIEAVDTIRKMVGNTEPKSALPGTIRGDYAHASFNHINGSGRGVANIVHASADAAEAKQEVAHWFSDSELYAYEAVAEKFTQPKKQ